jgi:2-desacetyl-2-hydroxyethyl bacteriochlorophyllide A dehydrogenase
MSPTARAFWVLRPGVGALLDESLPSPGPGDVLVRTRFSGISRGTETLVFTGQVPPTEYQRMRAPFQQGDFPGPVKYGYIAVGDVEVGPAPLMGRPVFVLYPHQTRFVVPASSVTVIPDTVPPARAVLAANMETALNVVWDASPLPGDRVAVVGAGVVGCLVASLIGRIPGCQVELIDPLASRAAVARTLGVRSATPTSASPDADLVIHASGTPAGLTLALQLAGLEATVVEASWYGTRRVELPLGEAFHSRRLRLVSSQVGMVAPTQRTRWTYARRLSLALALLADPALDVLIPDESPFEVLPDTLVQLSAAPGALCHRVRYD